MARKTVVSSFCLLDLDGLICAQIPGQQTHFELESALRQLLLALPQHKDCICQFDIDAQMVPGNQQVSLNVVEPVDDSPLHLPIFLLITIIQSMLQRHVPAVPTIPLRIPLHLVNQEILSMTSAPAMG